MDDQDFFGCHILLKALQRHLLPPPSQLLALQVNSSTCSAGSQASHAVGLTLPNSNSPRVWDPSVTLTWFSKLAKTSTQGVAAVAWDSYGEPQVRAECQGRSSGRRAVLKGYGEPPYQRYWPLPNHPTHTHTHTLSLSLSIYIYIYIYIYIGLLKYNWNRHTEISGFVESRGFYQGFEKYENWGAKWKKQFKCKEKQFKCRQEKC